MRVIILLSYIAGLALALPIWSFFLEYVLSGPTLPAGAIGTLQTEKFETWLARQSHFSFEAIIGNIRTDGVVIASPSTQHPDYFYTWTRDAAITVNSLVLQYDDTGATNATLEAIIDRYIESSYQLQRTNNPSGTFESLDGLGEPKFNIDGTPFTGSWGRPQRDGPPLRAIAMINYVNSKLRHDSGKNAEHFAGLYNNIIRYDLEYTARKWSEPGFDLWEEVYGSHFFTTIVQLRALVLGAEFATRIGDLQAAADYREQSFSVRRHLARFYASQPHLIETLEPSGRSGLDSALFLGAVHGLNVVGNASIEDVDNILFPPYSGAVLSALDSMISDMAQRYPINARRLRSPQKLGVAIGRYPEDVYNGDGASLGNPWFLCTATVAHTLYLLAQYLVTRDDNFVLAVDDEHRLYRRFTSQTVLSRDQAEYSELVRDIIDYADSFLGVIREHQAQDGTMSEQFSRYDGYMTGAKELTWSYGAFWSASRQRDIVLQLL